MKSLPKFNGKSIAEREQKFLKEGLETYKGVKGMSSDEYMTIRESLYNGKNVTNEIREKSLYHIIEVTASIYAKHDLEEMISFEDALETSICNFYNYFQEITFLHYYFSEFKGFLSKISFSSIFNECKKRMNSYENEVEFDPNELTKIIDNKYAIDPNAYFNHQEIRSILLNRINKMSKQDAKILIERYGLESGKIATLEEVGNKLGMTRQAVEQRLKFLLKSLETPKLREYLNDYSEIVTL